MSMIMFITKENLKAIIVREYARERENIASPLEAKVKTKINNY